MTEVRLVRDLSAGAQSERRIHNAVATSADGSLTTVARESDEGNLVITVIARAMLSLVRVGWTLLFADGVGPSNRLVTPLAPSRHGFVAAYDVGDVTRAVAVDIWPAQPLEGRRVHRAEIDAAFDAVQFGSARRAWLAALSNGILPPDVKAQVTGHLQAESDTAGAEPC